MLDLASLPLADIDRTVRAVEKVRERMLRAAAVFEAAKIPYAVIGGNAVAAWVSRVDEGAVRFTQDVDILLRREDFSAAKEAMEAAGFIYRHVRFIDMFLDGPGTKVRDAVHILFANEKVREGDLASTSDVVESLMSKDDLYRHLDLEALVRMKLTSHRLKDRVHLQDMVEVGLIDTSWPTRFPGELGERLQAILDNPEG
jgi:PAS domain-containing protein